MWLGSFRDKRSKPLGIKWPEEPLRLLGVYISYNEDACKQKNFGDKLIKMKTIINMWKGRNLTLIGRAQIIKTFIMSQLLYVSSALDVPADVQKEVTNLIFNFIWKGRKDKIKRSTLIKDIAEGGMKIPSVEIMLQTSLIKWIKKLFSDPDITWPFFLSKFLMKSGIHLNILKYSNFDIKTLNIKPCTLPGFYMKMLKVWSEVIDNTHNKHTFLWYNRHILINGISCYYEDFFKAGAWRISDLYNKDGSTVPFSTWVNRGVRKSSMIRWMGLIHNTRSKININDNQTDETCKPTISLNKLTTLLSQYQSKNVYTSLLKRKTGNDVCIPRLNKYLELGDTVNWSEIYLRAYKYPIDTRTKEFQFKFLHDSLVNRYWLNKWRMAENNQCQICKIATDNIFHIYWECQSTRQFWSDFVEWCESKIGNFEFNVETVFLGCGNDTLFSLIMIGKRHIYCRRLKNEPPDFPTFISFVKSSRDTELFIAKENNTIEKFLKKWQNIL